MNWYKLANGSQSNIGVIDDTSIGNDTPPPPIDNFDGDDPPFEPDKQFIEKMSKWMQSGGINELCPNLIDNIIENISPVVRSKCGESNYNRMSIKDGESGRCQAIITFELNDNTNDVMTWNTIVSDIKSKALNSSLWKTLGITYEKASNYLKDGVFEDILLFCIFRFANQLDTNKASFWAYENDKAIIQKMKQERIENDTKKNLDFSTFSVKRMTNPKAQLLFVNNTDSNGQYSGFGLKLYIQVDYIYNIKFKSMTMVNPDGRAFAQLDPVDKEGVITLLNYILEGISDSEQFKHKLTDRDDSDPIVTDYPLGGMEINMTPLLDKWTPEEFDKIIHSIPPEIKLGLHVITRNKKKPYLFITQMNVENNTFRVMSDFEAY